MKLIKFLVALMFYFNFFAQTSDLGKPYAFNKKVKLTNHGYSIPKIENKKIEEAENNKLNSFDKVRYYGKPIDVELDLFQKSEKTTLGNGVNLYHFYIHSETALSLNLIFSKFKLAEGTILYIFDEDRQNYIGAYTALNNNAAKKLGTELLYSKRIYIEIQEPFQNVNKSELTIGRVIHGYKNLNKLIEKSLNESGDCHYDVNCPEGLGWSIPKDGVGMIINGSGGVCTGSLINNTANDNKPYFLTAFHCETTIGTSPESWVFRFKWESPKEQTVCGTGKNSVNGPEIYNINGGVTRAKYNVSDFHLIELDTIPDDLWKITYNGWDKRDIPASSGACVHHPMGDVKKISISNSSFQTASYNGGPPSHWLVSWSEGVTEGGSSGSPVFNELKRIVGQLQGGASACGKNDNTDYYGKFSESWLGGGTPETRLSDWLDPQKTNVDFIDANVSYILDPFIASKIFGADKTSCTDKINPKIVLGNGGSTLLTSAKIEININGKLIKYDWFGSLGLFETDTVSLPELTLLNGKQHIEVKVMSPNLNGIDDNLSNNSISSDFYVIMDTFSVQLTLNLDCYGDETTFRIVNSIGDEIFRDGPFTITETPLTINRTYCLNEQCYKFILNDSYGDGLQSFDCGSGSYYLTDNSLDTVAALLPSEANFNFQDSKSFCLGNATNSLDPKLDDNIMVYPNPSSEYIQLKTITDDTLMTVNLIDQSGRLIKTWNTLNSIVKLDVKDVANGSYLLIAQSQEQRFVQKVQIIH